MDKNRKLRIAAVVVLVLALLLGITAWYRLYRDVPQPAWIAADRRDDFLYGSVGAEGSAGMPYWIWLVLPRICPDHLPGQGGYAALGRPWEEGREMPAGFSKKTVGYVRVAANCALCHAFAAPTTRPDAVPAVVVAAQGPVDPQRLLTFYRRCAQDPHFNADEILSEIDMVTKLSFFDHLYYRFVLIPRTRQALLERSMLLDAELRRHSREPRESFKEERMKVLAAWLEEQAPRPPAPGPGAVRLQR